MPIQQFKQAAKQKKLKPPGLHVDLKEPNAGAIPLGSLLRALDPVRNDFERLVQLAAHYGVDGPNKWLLLSFCLASRLGLLDPVGGPKRRGRPKTSSFDEKRELVNKVEATAAERGLGIADACRTLARREPSKYQKGKSLENRYGEAKKQNDRMFGLAVLGLQYPKN
jgi:hypothetical protein